MLVDLLSMDNYIQFNIKIAQLLGLHTAVYISELLNINEKAVRKDKVNDDRFVVDRSYIERRTTLSKKEQIELDDMLLKLGILTKQEESEDSLTLNLTVLTSLVSAEPVKLEDVKKAVAAAKPKARRTKAEVIIQGLKSHVQVSNAELRQAYYEWIDAVYAKQGWMSAKSVTVAQRDIDNYSQRNLDVALKLLEIATTGGYREIQWAINSYEKDYKLTYHVAAPPSTHKATVEQLSEEAF